MDNAIIIAIITGIFSVVGVIVSNVYANSKMQKDAQIAQAVTDTKIQSLTDEVRKHNGFAQRIPVIEEQIKNLDKRLGDVEQKV